MSLNGNNAYDFERFSPQKRQPAKKAEIIKLPEPPKRERPKLTLRHVVKGLSIFAVCFAMVGSLIYNQIQLNELNIAIQKTNKALGEAQSEHVQLQMATQAKVSLDAVEQYALSIGMQKLQPQQVEYVKMNEQDKVEVAQSAGGESLWQRFADWVSGICS